MTHRQRGRSTAWTNPRKASRGFARGSEGAACSLEAWVAKELQIWVQTFPSEFYEHMFRLRGLAFASDSVKRPQYFAT
ncbi:hypothetical protein D3227_32775 [Mesorhizobium waimense]|uniref:Bacteriophage Mx8 p63 C-terminal domain-containing protein n=1 Tax=Mesorhizobium waimense TaxID=1300307 RepID=A0A3A5K938_9HYPH|nr:hypothetical protein D3227_32775 [Mesorhizobium waimense]